MLKLLTDRVILGRGAKRATRTRQKTQEQVKHTNYLRWRGMWVCNLFNSSYISSTTIGQMKFRERVMREDEDEREGEREEGRRHWDGSQCILCLGASVMIFFMRSLTAQGEREREDKDRTIQWLDWQLMEQRAKRLIGVDKRGRESSPLPSLLARSVSLGMQRRKSLMDELCY